MHIVRAFVGVDGFQVDHVADHVVFVMNAVAAVHVARHAGDVQRLAARVALDHGDHFGRGLAFVHQAAHAQAGLQAESDFSLHVGEFFLDQLVLRQRTAELLTVHGVLAGTQPAVFGRAQSAPGNAVTCLVQATEGALQAADIGHQVGFRHKHIVHDDFAGDRGAQAHLAFDLRGAQAFHAFFQDEAANAFLAADLAVRVFELGPDHEDVGDRAVGDPHLGALHDEAAVDRLGTREHAGRVRAVVGLGQAEAAHPFAGGEFGQKFLLLCFTAVFVDGVHDQ